MATTRKIITVDSVNKKIVELKTRLITLDSNKQLKAYDGEIESYKEGRNLFEVLLSATSDDNLQSYYNVVSVCYQMAQFAKLSEMEELDSYLGPVENEVKKLEKQYMKKQPVVKVVQEDRALYIPTLPPSSPTSSSSSAATPAVSIPVPITPAPTTANATESTPFLTKPKSRGWFGCCGSADDVAPHAPETPRAGR